MAVLPFVKYHGAGNDFILVHDWDGAWEKRLSQEMIEKICDRHNGIGADGLMLLMKGDSGADFYMRYYNSDGKVSTFCGNGGRCMVSFAHTLGVHDGQCRFLGADGWHTGEVIEPEEVKISMQDVSGYDRCEGEDYVLHTGSPHYVRFVVDVEAVDVFRAGREIRNRSEFPDGVNVNFVQMLGESSFKIRTYERGVEDETLACGTGVVAAAIASSIRSGSDQNKWSVHARGGDLSVEFSHALGSDQYKQVWLQGPVKRVFDGQVSL